jgi:hypothetical protein
VRPSTRFKLVAVAGRGNGLQAQVDAYRLTWRDRLLNAHLHRDAQIPVSEGILGKASLPPLHAFQSLGFEGPEGLATEAQ